MKKFNVIILLSLVATSIDALLLFVKDAPVQGVVASQKNAVQESQKEDIYPKRAGRQGQLSDDELKKELTQSMEYIFQLVTEKLKSHKPIWMTFEDNSVVERLNQIDIPAKRQRAGNRPNKRRPPAPPAPPTAETSRQYPELRVLHKRSFPDVPGKQQTRFQDYEYPDYALSSSNATDYNYEETEAETAESGNVAAIPLRIIRNGALRIKRTRGFITGAVPIRVAPIILTTNPENRRSSNIRVLLKGRVKFNYFEETKDLGPEIYLVQLITANDFDIVTQPAKRKEKNQKVPEAMRQKFETELDNNSLQTAIQSDLSHIIREVLREENANGSFYLDQH